jgi:putative solute:sodium symporter small subunit
MQAPDFLPVARNGGLQRGSGSSVNIAARSDRLCPRQKHTELRKPSMTPDKRSAYWRANLRLVAACLIVWFVCSYGFGILFVEELNRIRLGGFKLGFWFAQQGSIYVFVLLIFFYAWRMNKLDRKYDVHED